MAAQGGVFDEEKDPCTTVYELQLELYTVSFVSKRLRACN